MKQSSHSQELANCWIRRHGEVAIDGGQIPDLCLGADPLLTDSLGSTNSDMFVAITENICRDGDRIALFVELANAALACRIEELISVCGSNMPGAEIESCAVAAFTLNDDLARFSCGSFDSRYAWPKSLKRIADEFGGSEAVLSAIALVGVALAVRLMKERRYQSAWEAATAARKVASIVCARLLPAKTAISAMAKRGANVMHDGPAGKRTVKEEIRKIWASGKYSSRDICAEQECAALGMSFSTARKALRGTTDPPSRCR